MGHLAGQGDCPSTWSEFRRPRGGGWGRPRRGRADEPARRCVESPARGQGGEPSGGWVGTQGRPGCSPPAPTWGDCGSRAVERLQGGRGCGRRLGRAKQAGVGQAPGPPTSGASLTLAWPCPGHQVGRYKEPLQALRAECSEPRAQARRTPALCLGFPPGPAASAECKGPERVSPASGWRPGWRYHPDRWQTPLQGGEKVYRQPIQGKRPRTAKPWGPQRGSPDPRPDGPRKEQCRTPARGLGCTRGP